MFLVQFRKLHNCVLIYIIIFLIVMCFFFNIHNLTKRMPSNITRNLFPQLLEKNLFLKKKKKKIFLWWFELMREIYTSYIREIVPLKLELMLCVWILNIGLGVQWHYGLFYKLINDQVLGVCSILHIVELSNN